MDEFFILCRLLGVFIVRNSNQTDKTILKHKLHQRMICDVCGPIQICIPEPVDLGQLP